MHVAFRRVLEASFADSETLICTRLYQICPSCFLIYYFITDFRSPRRSCPLWCWDTTRWAPRNLPVVPTGEKIERNLPQLRRPKCWDRGSSRCSHPLGGQRLPHISNGRKKHHFLSLLSLVALMAFLISQNRDVLGVCCLTPSEERGNTMACVAFNGISLVQLFCVAWTIETVDLRGLHMIHYFLKQPYA